MSSIIGTPAPDFEIRDVGCSRRRWLLSEITAEGKPVVLLFYNEARSCDKAVAEAEMHAEEYSEAVNLFLIHCPEVRVRAARPNPEVSLPRDLRMPCSHGMALPPSEYGVRALPHWTLINSDGTIVRNEGPQMVPFSFNDVTQALAHPAISWNTSSTPKSVDRMAMTLSRSLSRSVSGLSLSRSASPSQKQAGHKRGNVVEFFQSAPKARSGRGGAH
eukprot:TRINITY_DN44733_c0_g1_i1.p1 TRINITY_DN44733_c0_g1~~TRINITY_DN44733_c0_g1_i1.p1  ORF type:complete len:217 (+),score=30.85 TRINITY_DN44733_c0_g1_i1:29-679(+)